MLFWVTFPKNVWGLCCCLPTLRNAAFPTATGGKGADTAIVSAWLEDEMASMVHWFIYINGVLWGDMKVLLGKPIGYMWSFVS